MANQPPYSDDALSDIANRIRLHSLHSTSASKSGHPTSSCSMAEILSVIFFDSMRHNVKEPRGVVCDRLVLSKGHACPALYGAWVEAGIITEKELLSLRQLGSDIEGHPTPRLPHIDVATGSLGQGLGNACGMAFAMSQLDKLPSSGPGRYRVFCVVGDSEAAEGSIWEAAAFAGHRQLTNLVAVIDANRLGQSTPTMEGHDTGRFARKFEAFGWRTEVVDGHDIVALRNVLSTETADDNRPLCVIAKTFKGSGLVPEIEDQMNWHGKPIPEDKAAASEKLILARMKNAVGAAPLAVRSPGPEKVDAVSLKATLSAPPNYTKGQKLGTRNAYGTALVKLGQNCKRVVALDAEMSNSTMSQDFRKEFADRFVECYVSEQNMISVATGLACRDRCIAFTSTFASFFARAYDQIRMGAVSQTNINLCGSHVGCSIGPDGPSQMALEDLAMFRAIPGATVFYPSDGASMERAVELAANAPGLCFLRATRSPLASFYANDHVFAIGKANVIAGQTEGSKCVIVGGGVTAQEAIDAQATLQGQGIATVVIDLFTIKPVDKVTLKKAVAAAGGRLVVVEDHYPEGGIGEACLEALMDGEGDVVLKKYRHLAVREVPRSGPDTQMLAHFGIDAEAIVKAVQALLK